LSGVADADRNDPLGDGGKIPIVVAPTTTHTVSLAVKHASRDENDRPPIGSYLPGFSRGLKKSVAMALEGCG
jgi:hypothetical protein